VILSSAVVEHHVVRPVRADGPDVAHLIDERVRDDKYAAGDPVRRAGSNTAVAVDGTRLQPAHTQAAARASGAAHENATALDRRARTSGSEADQVRANDHLRVALLVPEGKGAGYDFDPVSLRAHAEGARIGRNDIDRLNLDVAAANLVAGEQLDHADDAQLSQHQPTQSVDMGIVVESTLAGLRAQLEVVDAVVGRQTHAVLPSGKIQGHTGSLSSESLAGAQAKGGKPVECVEYDDLSNRAIRGTCDEFRGVGDLSLLTHAARVPRRSSLAVRSTS
jgi:hypothetical protein